MTGVQTCALPILRQVYDSIWFKRASVIDPDYDATAVAQVGDANIGGERQRLVRGGHGVHVVRLAGGGGDTMKIRAIPGCDAALDKAAGGLQDLVALPKDLVERGVAQSGSRLVAGNGIR